ncbi:MAG: DNA modification methylase [Pseudomonadota bacterium]
MYSNALQTLSISINEINPNSRRLREHSRFQLEKMRRLLDRFGQVVPILIDKNNTIIDGHLVWKALKDSGAKMIAAIRIDGKSDAEIRALRLGLNRLPQDSRWNSESLKVELEELISLSFEMDLTAFDIAEIDAILELDIPAANLADDGDELPELADTAVTQTGDIWALGNHRLLCGDALSSADLDAVMDGQAARMVFSDPPYNVRIDGFVSGLGEARHREFAQASGEMSDEQFISFLQSAIANTQRHVLDGALLYWFMDWRHIWHLLEAGRLNKLQLLNLIVWGKDNGGMGSLYRSQHELIALFKVGTAPHYNNVELGRHGRSRTNLWTYRGMNSFAPGRKELLQAHPTVKPVSLISDAIRDVTKRGDVVLDPFLGSGSTLIAAEETGRICRGVEIDALYVDVTIRRWEKLTGRDAVHAVTGATFHETCELKQAKEVPHG